MRPFQAFLAVASIVVLVFELLVLGILVFFPYLPDPGLSFLNWEIYLILAPLSTVLLLGLLYAWLLRLGTRFARRRSVRFESLMVFLSQPFLHLLLSARSESLPDAARSLRILSRPRLMLAISLIAGTLLVLVPYRSDLNPAGNLVGVDSQLYVSWITQMLQRPLPQAVQYAFVEGTLGSRPLLLVLLYAGASAGISPSQLVEFLPAVLAPILTLSTYGFVRFGAGSEGFGGLAALFTSFSFYSTVGLWGGYYANWFAMVEAYLFLTCLLAFSRTPSAFNYGLMLLVSIALFLTHPWTWALIMAVSILFAVSLLKETHSSAHVKSMISIVGVGIVLDLLKNLAFSSRSIVTDIATKVPAGVGSPVSFWNNLVEALLYVHGGLLGNWFVLGTSFLAVFVLRFKDWFDRLLILWIAAASLPFLIVDSYHQARIVYDLPIPILTAVPALLVSRTTGFTNKRCQGIGIVMSLIIVANYAVQGLLYL